MKTNEYFSIAIDGPAGSGKSTIAKEFAEKCKNFTYINTGSMFRAIAYFCSKNNIDINDTEELSQRISPINIELEHNLVFIIDGDNKEEISHLIRTPEIDKLASQISKIKVVREKLLHDQIMLSKKSNVIMDGRDIGTVVLPNASLKIFLTADINVRAQRRFDELKDKVQTISLEQIQNEIKQRDEEDIKRTLSPLMQSKDAILIDSTSHTIEEILSVIQQQYLIRNKKNILNEIKAINKETNNLISNFVDIYNDVYIKKDLITYDEVIELDYRIYDLHNLFVEFLENFTFLKTKIRKRAMNAYDEIVNEIKYPIDDFITSKKFDLFYYSHLLVKMYILIPYVYEAIAYFIYKIDLERNQPRREYLIFTRFLPKYLNWNYSLFMKIDQLDLKITTLLEDNNDYHPQLQDSYSLTHKKFTTLFNQFIILHDFDKKEVSNAFRMSFIYKHWYYILVILIVVIAVLLVIIILATK